MYKMKKRGMDHHWDRSRMIDSSLDKTSSWYGYQILHQNLREGREFNSRHSEPWDKNKKKCKKDIFLAGQDRV